MAGTPRARRARRIALTNRGAVRGRPEEGSKESKALGEAGTARHA